VLSAIVSLEVAFGRVDVSKELPTMFEPFHEIVDNVSSTVKKHEADSGRPVIGVMPAYFPMELVDAAGGYAVQLWGNHMPLGKSDAYLQAFCCTVAKSMLELELSGGAEMVKGYAFTSICDTLINLRELYGRLFDKPSVELAVPVTSTEQARGKYLQGVLDSVLEGLSKMTGTKVEPDALAAAAKERGKMRSLQRELYRIRREKPGAVSNFDFYAAIKAGQFLPPAVYNEMLETLIAEMEKLAAADGKRMKLVLSGLVFEPIGIMKVFDELDIDIVDDDFANGWRTISKGDLNTADLVEGVTDYIFNPAPCCCIYNPNSDRHPYLIKKVKDSGADGVMMWYVKFCEPDAFDRPQLIGSLKEAGIPATFFDIELAMKNLDSIKTRISAFREMIEG
jgi:bcr-type benzoyl-CoA reductase subunit C